jgi:hypothetical protein
MSGIGAFSFGCRGSLTSRSLKLLALGMSSGPKESGGTILQKSYRRQFITETSDAVRPPPPAWRIVYSESRIRRNDTRRPSVQVAAQRDKAQTSTDCEFPLACSEAPSIAHLHLIVRTARRRWGRDVDKGAQLILRLRVVLVPWALNKINVVEVVDWIVLAESFVGRLENPHESVNAQQHLGESRNAR